MIPEYFKIHVKDSVIHGHFYQTPKFNYLTSGQSLFCEQVIIVCTTNVNIVPMNQTLNINLIIYKFHCQSVSLGGQRQRIEKDFIPKYAPRLKGDMGVSSVPSNSSSTGLTGIIYSATFVCWKWSRHFGVLICLWSVWRGMASPRSCWSV